MYNKRLKIYEEELTTDEVKKNTSAELQHKLLEIIQRKKGKKNFKRSKIALKDF